MRFSDRVYEAVKRIPKGMVSTYSEVAKAAGNPKASRAVGQILKRNRNPCVPCHRVVLSSGTLGGFRGGKTKEKESLLRSEGVRIINGRVSAEHFFSFE